MRVPDDVDVIARDQEEFRISRLEEEEHLVAENRFLQKFAASVVWQRYLEKFGQLKLLS